MNITKMYAEIFNVVSKEELINYVIQIQECHAAYAKGHICGDLGLVLEGWASDIVHNPYGNYIDGYIQDPEVVGIWIYEGASKELQMIVFDVAEQLGIEFFLIPKVEEYNPEYEYAQEKEDDGEYEDYITR